MHYQLSYQSFQTLTKKLFRTITHKAWPYCQRVDFLIYPKIAMFTWIVFEENRKYLVSVKKNKASIKFLE